MANAVIYYLEITNICLMLVILAKAGPPYLNHFNFKHTF